MRLFCVLILFITYNHLPIQAGISEEKCEEYEKFSYKLSCSSLLPINFGNENCAKNLLCTQSTPLIVGGELASLHEFPHYALLGYNFGNHIFEEWKFLCGGSLISENFILTAAHCRSSQGREASLVRLGESDLNPMKLRNDDVAEYRVKEFITHPDYSSETLVNDIALIKLVTNVRMNKNVRPACLHLDKTQVLRDKTALAIGFGATGYGEKTSEVLLKVNLTVVHQTFCKDVTVNQKVEKSQLCVKGEKTSTGDFKDTCQGDSGGPIQFISSTNRCMYTLIGIVSNGRLCGYDIPAIYTRIASYIPWIESQVWQ